MERLMERLDRKITWTLVPPCPAGGNQSLMQRVEKARNASAGLAPEPEEADLRFAAAGAWHLVATDVADTVAGALRMNIIDRRDGPLTAQDMLRFSHIEFPSAAARDQHLQVLECLLNRAADQPVIVIPGRFFASPAWRGSGLAAVLGVAAIAMARLHHSRWSANFTAVRGRAPELYRRLGGSPAVLPDGRTIETFVCSRHGSAVQSMLFDALRPGVRAEPGVRLVGERLAALMSEAAAPQELLS